MTFSFLNETRKGFAMKWHQIENSKLAFFAVRVAILAVGVVFCYHLTIGITLTKLEKMVNIAQWFQAKVDSLDGVTLSKSLERLVEKTALSEREAERVALDAQRLLDNFSPVIDLVLLYQPQKLKTPYAKSGQ